MKNTPRYRFTRLGIAASAALAAAFGVRTAPAEDIDWILDGTGPFTTQDNWSSGTVPGPDDTASFYTGGTAQITNIDDITVDLVTVSYGGLDFAGGSLTTTDGGDVRIGSAGGSGSLTMNGGTLSVAAALRFGDGADATVNVTDATIRQEGNGYLIFGGGGFGAVTATFAGESHLNHKGNWFIFGDNPGASATVTFKDTSEVTTDDWTFFGKGSAVDVTFQDHATFTNTAGATIVGEGNASDAAAKLTLTGDATFTHQGSSMFPVGHNGGTGTLEMSGNSQASVAGEVYIGNDASGGTLSNGTVNLSGNATFATVGKKFVISRFNGTGNVTVSGNATLDAGSGISVGGVHDGIVVGENGTATLTISDTATVKTASGDNIYIGSSPNSSTDRIVADGTVTLNGGALTATDASIILGDRNNNNAGTNNIGLLNLNGGTVTANSITRGAGTGTVNFNGSTVKSSTDSADYFSGFESTDLHVQAGGIKFDTNGLAVAITQDLDGTGGLQKLGTGTLTLVGASTFSGSTTISAGTLEISGSLENSAFLSIAATGALELDNAVSLNDDIVLTLVTGSDLVLSFAGTETIGALSIDGVYLEVGEYTLAELQAVAPEIFSGNTNAILNVTSAVPEPGVAVLLGLGAAAFAFRRLRR